MFWVVAAQPMIEVVQFKPVYPVQYAEHGIKIRQIRIKGSTEEMTPGIVIRLKFKIPVDVLF